MTKKDYIKFASAIKNECRNGDERYRVARMVGNIFQADSASFDRERFEDACGVSDQELRNGKISNLKRVAK